MTVHFVNLLDDLLRRSTRMANLVEDMLQEACEAVSSTNENLARRVITRDAEIDEEEVQIEAEVIRLLALYQPVGSDLRLLCTVLKVNSDLERIADCAVNIAERACYLDSGVYPQAADQLRRMQPIVRRMLRHAVQSYALQTDEHARKVFDDEEIVDTLYGELIKTALVEERSPENDVPPLLDILSSAKNLERIADHVTNIAEDIIFLATGEIVRHRSVKPESPD